MQQTTSSNIDFTPVWIALLLLGALSSYWLINGIEDRIDYIRLRAFKPHIESYVNIPNLKHAPQQRYIRGRIIPVDPDRKRIHLAALRLLPNDLRAQSPDEVGTIMWVRSDYRDYTIALIDRSTSTVVWQKEYVISSRTKRRDGYHYHYQGSSEVHYQPADYSISSDPAVFIQEFLVDLEGRWYRNGRFQSLPKRGWRQ